MQVISYVRSILTVAMLSTVALAQTDAPSPQPAAQPAPSARAAQAAPVPHAAAAPNANPFPPIDKRNFNSTTPSLDVLNAFLKAQLGYNANLVWQVSGIRKTINPDLVEVSVLVADKTSPDKAGGMGFLVEANGKYAIQSDQVIPFGANPFAGLRATLAAEAAGPARGAAKKELLLVEFSDMQCPHCKEAQTTVDKLVKDFPSSRFVYENFPLVTVHPWAYKAAEYSVCVAQQDKNQFTAFVQAVFDTQEQITVENADGMLKAAVTKSGADAAKAVTCSTSPAAAAAVDASMDLAAEVGVNQTPTLFVNGRKLPLNIPYELLHQIVEYQAQLDGVPLPPPLSTLK